jgi:hypothetical protein
MVQGGASCVPHDGDFLLESGEGLLIWQGKKMKRVSRAEVCRKKFCGRNMGKCDTINEELKRELWKLWKRRKMHESVRQEKGGAAAPG